MLFFTFCSLPFVLYIKILEITNFFIFKNIFIFLVQNIYSLNMEVFLCQKKIIKVTKITRIIVNKTKKDKTKVTVNNKKDS